LKRSPKKPPPVTHSPGPWEIDRTKRYYKPCIRANGVIICWLADNGADALFPGNWTKLDAANARLIVAAPAMLAELEKPAAMLDERAAEIAELGVRFSAVSRNRMPFRDAAAELRCDAQHLRSVARAATEGGAL